MAKKCHTEIARAFVNGQHKATKNTYTDGHSVWYHGHKIVWRENGQVRFSLCGWNTVTTRGRINTILDMIGSPVRVYQRDFEAKVINVRSREEAPIYSTQAYALACNNQLIVEAEVA